MRDDWLIEVSDKAGDFKICCCLVIESRRGLVKGHSVPPIENFKAFSLYTNKSKVERVSDIVTGVVVNQGSRQLTIMTCYVLSGVSFLNSKYTYLCRHQCL